MILRKKIILIFCMANLFLISLNTLGAAKEENSVLQQQSTSQFQEHQVMIDLNSATAEELMSLKNIGKKRAEAIVADRQQNGKFHHIEELSRVKGIGKQASKIILQNQGRVQASK